MAVIENPSARKFGPPPENAQRERTRLGAGTKKTLSALGPAALMIGIYALRSFAHSRRGWGAALGGFLAVAGYGAQYIFARRKRDGAPDGGDPYTPPTSITR